MAEKTGIRQGWSNCLDLFKKLSVIEASAPCRVDLGGTLDLRTFYYPLHRYQPCTFNIAIDMRTRVLLKPYTPGRIRISSKGFSEIEYSALEVRFDHPLALISAVADYFGANGIWIDIESASPPKSALGGSSAAAVATVAGIAKLLELSGRRPHNRRHVAILSHGLEETVAGVPCGMQDQLAAAYGGVNLWHWPGSVREPLFRREPLPYGNGYPDLERHILLAYGGVPHESVNINGKWVAQFLGGKFRSEWIQISDFSRRFFDALSKKDFTSAAEIMNRETTVRRIMTPDVVDGLGAKLIDAAMQNKCGARFTGAGGGGCLWALGRSEDIDRLKAVWKEVLEERDTAALLPARIDRRGLVIRVSL